MKKQEQRIAIAEACGYEWTQTVGKGWRLYQLNSDETFKVAPLPDYLNDLNAMHEAERELHLLWFEYANHLGSVNHPENTLQFLHATAAQRAEAFLKTLNLWKEE